MESEEELIQDEPPVPERDFVPAGFIPRVLAQCIDLCILASFIWCIHQVLNALPESFVLEVVGGTLPGSAPTEIESWERIAFSLLIETVISYIPSFLFIGTLLFAHLEGGVLAGSPGKLLLGMHVLSVDGERLGFPRALVRNFLKIFSIATLGLGFLPVLFTPSRQAFHDVLGGSIVLRPAHLSIVRFLTAFFLFLFAAPSVVSLYAQGFRLGQVHTTTSPSHTHESTQIPVEVTPESIENTPAADETGVPSEPIPTSIVLDLPSAAPVTTSVPQALPVINIWGQSHQLQNTLGLVDRGLKQIHIAFFKHSLTSPPPQSVASLGNLSVLNPDALLTLNFDSLEKGCTDDTLRSYSLTIYRHPNGMGFPGERDFLQIGRAGTWKSNNEVSELVCQFERKGGMQLKGRFRHFANVKNGLEDVSVLWIIPLHLQLVVR